MLFSNHPIKEKSMWKRNSSPIWMASYFHLRRNLSSNLFPNKMDSRESHIILATLKQSLMHTSQLGTPTFYDMNTIHSWEKEYILEHFWTTCNKRDAEFKSGMIVDQSGTFLAILNGEDHLILHTIDTQSDWKQTQNKLFLIEAELSNNHSFAYSPQFGYLTSTPSNSGTAFTVQAFLHLPALIHLNQIEEVLVKEIDDSIRAKGLREKKWFIGDILVIENRYTLGITENHILEEVHQSATKLINLEKTLRNDLIEMPPSEIINQTSRAIGLLKYAHEIELEEALSALSFIKLGIDLKWVSGLSDQDINPILFGISRAHLTFLNNKPIIHDQLTQKRAKFLQKALKSITMNT